MAEHAGNIASDLSVFHRVDDVDALPIARYVALAHRLGAYDGVMRHQLAATAGPAAAPGAPTPVGTIEIGGQSIPMIGEATSEQVAEMQRSAAASRYGVDPAQIVQVSGDTILSELSR